MNYDPIADWVRQIEDEKNIKANNIRNRRCYHSLWEHVLETEVYPVLHRTINIMMGEFQTGDNFADEEKVLDRCTDIMLRRIVKFIKHQANAYKDLSRKLDLSKPLFVSEES